MLSPEELKNKLDQILPKVRKPGRYTGGEVNQIVKDWTEIDVKVALVFPDIYDLGMSNLGLAILYDQINHRQDALAERTFSPWTDMEDEMRSAGIPAYSLESKHALSDFDIIGITLPYESIFTNALNIIDLAGIPLFQRERSERHPLVIAGGQAAYNPEPMHAFIDAFVIGEGESAINEIIDTYHKLKKQNEPREKLLEALSEIAGVYVPSLYNAHYNLDGVFSHIERKNEQVPLPILKRIEPHLPPPVTHFVVPYIETVHDRIPIEIMRGCTRGCRFCHAGMVNRPVRERSIDEIIDAIQRAIHQTGLDEVGLLSLSSSDYTQILELVERINAEFTDQHISISLPSLRIDTVSVELMDALVGSRKGGFTLAPEAATERMRNIINKPISSKDLLETTEAIYSRDWTSIKLYFMIGHPSETTNDVLEIANLARQVLRKGRQKIGRRARVNVGVSTFVPKPHTPFQWVPTDTIEQIISKQTLLKKELRSKSFKLNWNAPEETILESALSRGDRRLSDVIYHAWRNGAKFDGWGDHFKYDTWLEAFDQAGLDITFYTHRKRDLKENLPWDHISTSVNKEFLIEDYLLSKQGAIRIDCRDKCYPCGVLPSFAHLRRENPGSHWLCPEVKSKKSTK